MSESDPNVNLSGVLVTPNNHRPPPRENKQLTGILIGVIMAIKAALQPIRFIVPERLRKAMVSLLLGRFVERLPSRNFLDTSLVSALAGAGAKRILFVGTQRYNQPFFQQCQANGLEMWSIDIDANAAVWGVPTKHIVGDVRDVNRLARGLTFDAVILNGIFGFGVNHAEDAGKTIRALAQVLVPGGVLVVGWNPGLSPDYCKSDGVNNLFVPTPLYDLPSHVEFAPVAQIQPFPHVYDVYCLKPEGPTGCSDGSIRGKTDSIPSVTGHRSTPLHPRFRARQITDADVASVAELLTTGFPLRSRQYWQQALGRLEQHQPVEGLPKYGYLMERDGVAVGVLLLISSRMWTGTGWATKCNVSSWYVDPTARGYAPLLVAQALKRADVTYQNISSERFTRPIIEANGFRRYTNGQFVALAVPRCYAKSLAHIVDAGTCPSVPFEPHERELLSAHAEHECWSFWCVTPERAYPFVFVPRVMRGILPCGQLLYCRDIQDVARFARPIASYLVSRRHPLMVIDSNGPIHGLVGRYFDGSGLRYFKGPIQPRLGDLSYTEAGMFGI